jgi:hypothetical protein
MCDRFRERKKKVQFGKTDEIAPTSAPMAVVEVLVNVDAAIISFRSIILISTPLSTERGLKPALPCPPSREHTGPAWTIRISVH